MTEQPRHSFSSQQEHKPACRDMLSLCGQSANGVGSKHRRCCDSYTSKWPLRVHDLSAKAKKKIELKLEGEETELDKTVVETKPAQSGAQSRPRSGPGSRTAAPAR